MEVTESTTLLAHDLKTPLSIILLETELVGARIPAEMVAVHRSLERIAQNTAYIDRLISELLDLASVDAGTLQLQLDLVDLAQLLRATVDRAVSTVDRDRVRLDLKDLVLVRGDRARLERVLANFLSNALKYSRPTTEVTVVLEAVGPRARVTVVDHGRGLAPQAVRTVFDRHHRSGKNPENREGYGLGLYISRKIIMAHGGEVGVSSVPGEGSRFFFELDTIQS